MDLSRSKPLSNHHQTPLRAKKKDNTCIIPKRKVKQIISCVYKAYNVLTRREEDKRQTHPFSPGFLLHGRLNCIHFLPNLLVIQSFQSLAVVILNSVNLLFIYNQESGSVADQ